ncbi:glycoside hydrolase family 2 protein [Nonomuraea sp. M3C6]|uniref:Glycoside hydrolase family 2 protein n=1 Tax=Nonomuraea marmarensis TaxID=3351344 RepID=A0ABW7ALN4_9ACTN
MSFDVTRRDVLKGMGAAAVVLAVPAGATAYASAETSATRQTLDLAGMWEFGTDGATYPHSVAVPNFLVPVGWWIYTPDDFPEEVNRIASYGYDASTLTEGWYRRVVTIPAAWAGRRVELRFDGIAMYSEIRVNGTLTESSWGMWRTHRLDVTGHVQAGQPLTIDVYVKMDQRADTYSHGEFGGLSRAATSKAMGIWESVRLVATDPILVDDVFFKPRTDGADIDVTVANHSSTGATLTVRNVATAVDGGATLFERVDQVTVGAGATGMITASASGVQPRLWSPDDPRLYLLTTTVERDGTVLDEVTIRVGFRTFEVRGNTFHLNGNPYWMRGAGHLPTVMVGREKIPQMRQWLELLRDDNVRVTRMHMGPAPSPWFDLTDEIGFGVDMEGIRQWAFSGEPAPAQVYVDAWYEEMIDVIRRVRNHPSVLLWTTGNEMGCYDLASWTVLSNLNKAIRAADPTRPLVADSYYMRNPKTYESTLKPAGIDDGDVDDAHLYFGWYQPSAFVLTSGQTNGGSQADQNRPFISAELGTGYPDFHTGRPEDTYLNLVHAAQPWVGAHAADADPAIFLDTHAMLNKELAEMLRRTRFEGRGTTGFLLFSTATWFKDFYSNPTIGKFPVNDAVRLAYQPVLVSLDSAARHFYAGEQFQTAVVLVNDHTRHGATTLSWEIVDAGGQHLAGAGSIPLPAVAYHANVRANVTIAIPATLAADRVAAVLHLTVTDGATTISRNQYDIVLATHAYAAAGTAGGADSVWLYDPTGATRPSLDAVGLQYTTVGSLIGLAPGNPDLLVIGKGAVDDTVLAANLRDYADAGGRVVILEGGDRTRELFPAEIATVKSVDGEVVTPVHDDSAVFADMDPMDMRWWRHNDGSKPYVTHRAAQFDRLNAVNIARLGIYTAPGPPQATPTFDERSGYPIFLKKTRPDSTGYLVVSELTTSTSATVDPLAGKLLANLLAVPASVPLDPPPPSWDGFTEGFENGLGAWTVLKGTLAVSTAKAHTGTHSLGRSGGPGVVYRQGTATHGTVTLWFYDDAASTNTMFVARVDDDPDTGHFRGIGVRTDINATHYVLRVDGTFSVTSVVRTTGWHQFRWDYTSGTGVTMSIDGQQIGTATGLAMFSTIALGDWWGIQSESGINFVDDIAVVIAS